MPRPQIIKNPFYLLLSLVGFAFVISVCVYWLMTLAVIRDPLEETPRDGLFRFFEDHGTTLLIAEVSALLVLCVIAMATDNFWMSRLVKDGKNEQQAENIPAADESSSAAPASTTENSP